MKIGVLDSGVGGFSILASLEKNFPQHHFLYLSDSKNFPYSEKTVSELQKIGVQNAQKLIALGCHIIVIACNTLTVTVLTHLRASFPEIIFVGTVPAVKPAAEILPTNSHIVVLATKNTAESEYLTALVEPLPAQTWTLVGSTKLVAVIENWNEPAIIAELQIILLPIQQQQKIDAVVLGCTHFPFVESFIEKILGTTVIFFEPSLGISKQLTKATAEFSSSAESTLTSAFENSRTQLSFISTDATITPDSLATKYTHLKNYLH